MSNTDLTDTYATTTLATVAGQQLVSRQLLDQSPINVDSVIFSSLSQVWAQQQDILADGVLGNRPGASLERQWMVSRQTSAA